MIRISNRKAKKEAMPRENGPFSNQLQKGKNTVAKMPPNISGIKKDLAKYKPATTKKNRAVFFNTEFILIVIS